MYLQFKKWGNLLLQVTNKPEGNKPINKATVGNEHTTSQDLGLVGNLL